MACYEWGPFGFDGQSRTGKTVLHEGDDLRKIGGRGTWQSYGSGWANLGNTPLRLYKHFTHEGGLSTPFVVSWPAGIEASEKWIREPVHVMDVMPTLLEVSGAKYPKKLGGKKRLPLEGRSLVGLMNGGSLGERGIGFSHFGAKAWREGHWKLVWGKKMPGKRGWELYNIQDDRAELNDLAENYPKRVAEMKGRWKKWAERTWVNWDHEKEKARK